MDTPDGNYYQGTSKNSHFVTILCTVLLIKNVSLHISYMLCQHFLFAPGLV